MLDVGQLVRHHATHFAGIEQAQQAGGGRHGGVLRIAAGGEGVGRVFIDEIDARHGEFGLLGQLLHGLIELGGRRCIHLAGVVHLQHHFVGKPVGEEVGDHGKAQRHDHAVPAPDGGPDDTEERGDGGHQGKCLDPVEHAFPWDEGRSVCGKLPLRGGRGNGETRRADEWKSADTGASFHGDIPQCDAPAELPETSKTRSRPCWRADRRFVCTVLRQIFVRSGYLPAFQGYSSIFASRKRLVGDDG